MSLHWSDFPDAPEVGASIYALDEVVEGSVLSFNMNEFPVLVLKIDGTPKALVNTCPHQFLPLDHKGDALLSADGRHLLCTNHGAKFQAEDGVGVSGEGIGCQLNQIPVDVRDGLLVIASE